MTGQSLLTSCNPANAEFSMPAIVDMDISHEGIGEEHDMFCSSYIKFYIPNGAVIMPAYGVASDKKVHSFLSNLFAERQVEMVNINAIAPAGGGIHCITQQQPA